MCRKNSHLVKIWHKYQALYMKTLSMFYTADSNICKKKFLFLQQHISYCVLLTMRGKIYSSNTTHLIGVLSWAKIQTCNNITCTLQLMSIFINKNIWVHSWKYYWCFSPKMEQRNQKTLMKYVGFILPVCPLAQHSYRPTWPADSIKIQSLQENYMDKMPPTP
jgi:hypothetical protein